MLPGFFPVRLDRRDGRLLPPKLPSSVCVRDEDPDAEFRSGPKKFVIPFRMELESSLESEDSEIPSAWATELIVDADDMDGEFDDADACIPPPDPPNDDANDDSADDEPLPWEPLAADPL